MTHICISGPNYVPSNQSWLLSHRQRQQRIEQELNSLKNKITPYLVSNYHIPLISPIFKLLFNDVKNLLTRFYMNSLPVKEEKRIQREQKLIESIKTKLVDFNLVLRQTDKSRVFHIGQAIDYDLKAAAYRTKTGAYIELSYNPLSEIVDKVTRLLNDLRMKKQIRAWQYKRMMPNRQKVKLGHMYFLPKSHKVH